MGKLHERKVYNIIRFIADVGGVLEVFMVAFAIFLTPLAYFNFILSASAKFEEMGEGGSHLIFKERCEKMSTLKFKDKFLLYVSQKLGGCFKKLFWSEDKKEEIEQYQDHFIKTSEKIDKNLDLVELINMIQ